MAGAINCTSFLVNGTAVATGTGSVWGVSGSSAYYTSGSVGIGTASPSQRLHVFGDGARIMAESNTGSNAVVQMKTNANTSYLFTDQNGALQMYGDTGKTVAIMNSNTVGIGSTNTQSNMLRIFGGNDTSGISLGDYMTSAGVKYIGITAVSNGTSLGPSSGFSGITFGSPFDGGGTSGYLAFHTHGYGISSDERMRIDKGGKVGIGKTNPSQLLDVNGAINCTSFLVNGTAVATGTGSVWGVSGSIAYYTSGNVGISTTAAITNLHVRVPTYSSPVFIVDAGGQGTDTTPPRGIGKPLIGVGAYSWSNVSSGDYYGIGFGYNANNGATIVYPAEIGFLTQTTAGGTFGDLVFSTRPTTTGTTIASERMRITSGGLIGIGTTNPNTYLCVGPNGGVNQTTQIPGISMTSVSGQNMHYSVGQGTAGTNNVFLKWGYNATASSGFGSVSCYAGNNPLVLQEGGGNVGIGTVSPAYKLVVQTATSSYGIVHTDGTISLSTWVGTSGATGAWLGTMTNHDLQFFTNAGVSRMTINTSGNVGIGTATPGSKLHIYSTTANDGILFQNAYNSSTGSIALYTSTAAGNFILDGTADAGIVLPTAGKDLYLNRTTSLYTSVVVKGGTGNVGIGTATPSYPTSISNSGFINLEINRTGAGTNYGVGTVHSLTSSTGTFRGEYAFAFGGATTIATTAQTQAYGYYAVDLANAGVFGVAAGGLTSAYFFMTTSSACFPKTNVGIGTVTPGAPLHIYSATADYTNSLIVNTLWPSIRLGSSSVTGRDWVILNGGSGAGIGAGNFGIFDATANTYRFMIDSNGNVGIGNFTSITTKLYVNAGGNVSNGILQFNAGAADADSKTRLSGLANAALMPSASGASIFFYTTSGTTLYRSIIAASSYFTGQHANQPIDTDLKTNIQNYVGLIVSSADQGYYSINPITNEIITGSNAITITEALPYIELTATDQDPAVWGVLTNVKNDNLNTDGTTPVDNDEEWGDRLGSMVRVNGLGEGAVWVTNINGNIRNGDLICSSMIPGYGRKQNDDLFHSYTVAKATMSCNFDLSTTKYQCKTITHDGTEYIAAFIGCSYHCS